MTEKSAFSNFFVLETVFGNRKRHFSVDGWPNQISVDGALIFKLVLFKCKCS